jgi:ribosomal protein L32
MIAPDVVQQLEAARAGLLADLAKVDDAIAALTDGARPTPQERPVPRGRPVKKAPPVHRGASSTKHLNGKRTGRAPKWDVALAERLWKSGVSAQEIADRTGAPGAQTVYERAARLKWGKRQKATSPTRKCRACGSTVTPGQACPSCGITA